MNSFISSQFNYCPLVGMFNDRATNAKLNRTFEKAGMQRQYIKARKTERKICDHSSARSAVADG